MDITKKTNKNTVNLELSGRLDTITSNKLSEEISRVFKDNFKVIVFDLLNLEYISSAGLRVLLAAQKKVNSKGLKMKIKNVNETVREVFEITGFNGIMEIE